MYCKNCGNKLNPGELFCPSCGQKVDNVVQEPIEQLNAEQEEPIETIQINEQNVDEPKVQMEQPVDFGVQSESNIPQEQMPIVEPEVNNDVQGVEQEVQPEPINNIQPESNIQTEVNSIPPVQPNSSKKGGKGIVVVFIILGICILIGLGIIFGPKLLPKKTSTTGSNTETSLTSNSNVFYGEGYNLTYDDNWSVISGKKSSGEEAKALKYKDSSIILSHNGTSSLSQFEDESGKEFSTSEGKKALYDEFYDYWNSEEDFEKMTGGSNGFSILSGKTYYASMDYGDISKGTAGQMYIIVNQDSNIVITIMSQIYRNFDKSSKNIIDLLKTIKITTEYNDELAGYLNNMSNWNRYSSLRQGNLGKKKVLTGGWRFLGESEAYWEFKNDEFWWYKSYNDLNDNYWYGKYKKYTGTEAATILGIDPLKIAEVIANNKDKNLKESDIHALVLYPKKLISGGIDKTEEKIKDDSTIKIIWIIIDHGSEGIEAQSQNPTDGSYMYLVKIKD